MKEWNDKMWMPRFWYLKSQVLCLAHKAKRYSNFPEGSTIIYRNVYRIEFTRLMPPTTIRDKALQNNAVRRRKCVERAYSVEEAEMLMQYLPQIYPSFQFIDIISEMESDFIPAPDAPPVRFRGGGRMYDNDYLKLYGRYCPV